MKKNQRIKSTTGGKHSEVQRGSGEEKEGKD